MRLVTLILVWTIGLLSNSARGDETFTKVAVDGHVGYVVPKKLAPKLDVDYFHEKATGYWSPGLKDLTAAEKAARQKIKQATIAPKKAFPEIASHPGGFAIPTLEKLKSQALVIDKDYDSYVRQFVGLLLFNGKKQIYCNYFVNQREADFKGEHDEFNPARQFVQVEDGGAGFWQCIYDVDIGQIVSVSFNYSP